MAAMTIIMVVRPRAALLCGMVTTNMETAIIGLPTVVILSPTVIPCITHDSTTKRIPWMRRYHCSVGS